jgi:hypothetical protein
MELSNNIPEKYFEKLDRANYLKINKLTKDFAIVELFTELTEHFKRKKQYLIVVKQRVFNQLQKLQISANFKNDIGLASKSHNLWTQGGEVSQDKEHNLTHCMKNLIKVNAEIKKYSNKL